MTAKWIKQRKIVLENCNHDILTIVGETAINKENGDVYQYYYVDTFRKGVWTSHSCAFELEDLTFENLGHAFRLTVYKNGTFSMFFLNNYGKKIKVYTVKPDIFFRFESDSSKRDRRKE